MRTLRTMWLLFLGCVLHPRSTTVVYEDGSGKLVATHYR